MNPQDLADLFRRYDVALDASTVRALLEGEDEEQRRILMEWAKTHLTEDTLLTKDELNSYRFLERNGKANSLAASSDLSQIQGISDQELQDAIFELNRSTEAINKQADALRQQQDALSRLVGSSGKNGDARAAMEVKQLHEWEMTRNALNTAIELLSQSLDYRVSEMEQHSKTVGEDVTSIVNSVLRSDDKLLASLQKLGYELDSDDPEEVASVTKLREICARLIKYTVECIRTKLDRIYLEALEASQKSGASARVPPQEITAQKDELEELYSEILPVAQMSVEQQWLEPSLRSLSSRNGNSVNRSGEALEYILKCLDYLLDRIDRLSARVSSSKEYEAATGTLTATAKAELSKTVKAPTKRRTTLSSPVRKSRHILTDDLTTPAPSRAGPPRRPSIDDNPLEHLLGGLGLSLPPTEDAETAQTQTHILATTLAERRLKSADVAHNVQSTFERTATSRLADARCALQLLRDSVLAESPFAEVHLVDPGIESSIGVLAQEVQMLAGRLEGVERAAAALTRGRNIKREEIIERWRR